MITPFVEQHLSAYLQGHYTADDAREVLRLIDLAEHRDGALVAEFDEVLRKISKNIPGLTLNFERLLERDPIECDPLVSQGNLAILRLDNLFHQAYAAWMKSGGSIQTIKRINKPANPATYSESTQQQIRTDETYPPDAQILNQIVNIALSGFRIQATITHRREHLKNPPVSRDATRSASLPKQSISQSQPEASARNAAQTGAQSESASDTGHRTPATGHSPSDIIDENEIFKSDLGNLSNPIEGDTFALIRGFNKFSILKGYGELKPLVKNKTAHSKATNPVSNGVPCSDRCTQRSEHAEAASTVAQDSRLESSNPRVPCSDGGTPQSEHADATNNVSQQPGEEEPVTLAQEINSSSPTDHWPQTTGHSPPPFHKRE